MMAVLRDDSERCGSRAHWLAEAVRGREIKWPSRTTVIRLAAAALLAASGFTPAAAQSRGAFDLTGERAQRAVVTISGDPPELAAAESVMTRRLKGVLADLSGKALEELRGSAPAASALGDPSESERVCVVHVIGVRERKAVEIFRGKNGGYVAVEPAEEGKLPRRSELLRDRFAAVVSSWPLYRGGFEPNPDGAPPSEPIGEVFEFPRPYVPGRFILDLPAIELRILNGAKAERLLATDRQLDQEKFWARLPKGYSPRTPAGLLVWVDPGNSGRPPTALAPACDELGLICIAAADSGNNRMLTNREQLALDAVETASSRYLVDPRRVYIAGLSGGGRVASIMQACFPDVFTGSVPIVGMSCYQNVPNGTGQYWRAVYVRPGSEMFRLFRSRRMAGITGERDGNAIEMRNASAIMRRDGVNVRLFDYPDMGHAMPTPERFLEALRWVDEPAAEARKLEQAAAAKAWETYKARFGDGPPPDEAARRMLVKVTEAGPWTAEAWRAAELLGLVGEVKPAASP